MLWLKKLHPTIPLVSVEVLYNKQENKKVPVAADYIVTSMLHATIDIRVKVLYYNQCIAMCFPMCSSSHD